MSRLVYVFLKIAFCLFIFLYIFLLKPRKREEFSIIRFFQRLYRESLFVFSLYAKQHAFSDIFL